MRIVSHFLFINKFPASTRLLLSFAILLFSYSIINQHLLSVIYKFHTHELPLLALSRIFLFIIGLSIFSCTLILSNRYIFSVLSLIILINNFSNESYTYIAGDLITEEVALWLFSETGSLSDAMRQFPIQFFHATFNTLLLMLLIYIARIIALPAIAELDIKKYTSWIRMGSFAALITFVALLARAQPDPIPWETNLTIHLMAHLADKPPIPLPVRIQRNSSNIRNIILVVDESVRADVFREQFGSEMSHFGAIELKNSWAASPCSGASNALLRWGVNPRKQYDQTTDLRTQPTLFGYAASANYRSHFFDAQSMGGVQNFMSTSEKSLINNFQAMSKGIDSDQLMAQAGNQELKKTGQNFIYMVKMGAHFPYGKNLPESYDLKNMSEHEKYVASVAYANKTFFAKLLDGIDRSSLLLIYTSDHGQNFKNGYQPHCNPKPLSDELIIPLWIISNNYLTPITLKTEFYSDKKIVEPIHSSLQIFPTLITAMGYNKEQVESEYYLSLDSNSEAAWLLRFPYIPISARKAGPVRFTDAQNTTKQIN